jgi:hypothetical protein
MVRSGIYIIIISLLLVLSGCDDEPALKEEDLSEFNKLTWLKGIWEGRQGDAKLYESWRSKNYRIMEGISYTTVNSQRVYIQTMRIEQSNNKITLHVKSETGSEETVLRLYEADDNKITFVNSEGGFPERVVYKKDNNIMNVEISGISGEEDKTQEFEYKKTGET